MIKNNQIFWNKFEQFQNSIKKMKKFIDRKFINWKLKFNKKTPK
jgi:hypothetical protein